MTTRILKQYRLAKKYTKIIIKVVNENCTTEVEHEGRLRDAIQIKSGSRQGCILSPMVFIITIMKTGINCTILKKPEDCLITTKKLHMQEKTTRLINLNTAKQGGLKIREDQKRCIKEALIENH